MEWEKMNTRNQPTRRLCKTVMISSAVNTSQDCNLVLFRQHMFFLLTFPFVSSLPGLWRRLNRALWLLSRQFPFQFQQARASLSTRQKKNSCITSLILCLMMERFGSRLQRRESSTRLFFIWNGGKKFVVRFFSWNIQQVGGLAKESGRKAN